MAVPAALIGAVIGTHLQGKVASEPLGFFFAIVRGVGVTFVVAFTLFRSRFT